MDPQKKVFTQVGASPLPRQSFPPTGVAYQGPDWMCTQATQIGYNSTLPSGQDPGESDEHADHVPWDAFWRFVQKFLGFANQLMHWLLLDDLVGEEARRGGPGSCSSTQWPEQKLAEYVSTKPQISSKLNISLRFNFMSVQVHFPISLLL